MSVDKKDPTKEDSEESMDSSPEGDAAPAPPLQQSENQQPKRKGGRKPIYATSEERKQRNRQAQAAFRERRTEYIKQLEEAIRTHEQNLANLQAAHRHAADECLMLRYKNSLLERILLEKGIDVQAELRAKTGSPNLGPTHVPQTLVQPPPIQRAILNRHHARRSNSGIAPKLEPGIPASPLPPPIQPQPSALSPRNRQTPSHSASPTGTTSFGSQPEQEYDAAADMMDDPGDAPDTPSGPGPYPGPTYAGEPQPMSLSSPVTTGPPGGQPIAGQSPIDNVAHSQHPAYPSMTQLLDNNYDFDPFGLSASMAFPTQFSFDTSNMR
ncbi:1ebd752f-bab6-494b-a9a2-7fbaa6453d8a [Thermothielavioides terrestris]|uniref:1ebd752f-bab6-494b-a9a2-7fbaa6453d8a n=1 Tax=Thermothielavioides terrestris TaxID=2587410 RepID=A0A3S4F2F8_9PEZI|nr:1ebd752f-bab6-494b-a9a2-7fbaa6453d8a [Thermothielavioides terrestris]